MSESGTCNGSSEPSLIGSRGANPCMIIAMYARDQKRAALAHMTALEDPRQVLQLLRDELFFASRIPPAPIEVHLASGYPDEEFPLAFHLQDLPRDQQNRLRAALSEHPELILRSDLNSSQY